MTEILKVDSVSKQFSLRRTQRTTLRDSLIRFLKGQREKKGTIWALRDVSFRLEQGRALGVIGHNGAGKSTLLRLLCGVGRPTSGQIYRQGQISGLLELGTGFHPALTGRENLLTAGILNGLTSQEVLEREKDIIEFSELEQFIDQPVRTYSTGMYLRLAFSVAIHFDPDVLAIDEVLTVGDVRFREKCMSRIEAFRKTGKTLILTSHDPNQIRNLCDEVLVLEEGRVVMMAAPDKASSFYDDLMVRRTERRTSELSAELPRQPQIAEHGSRIGTQEAAIDAVHILNTHGKEIHRFNSGEGLTVELQFSLSRPLPDVLLVLGVYSDTDVKCFETSISSIRTVFGSLTAIKRLRCYLPEIHLLPGRYQIVVGLYPPDCDYTYDYHWQMHPLIVSGGDTGDFYVSGVVLVKPQWSAE